MVVCIHRGGNLPILVHVGRTCLARVVGHVANIRHHLQGRRRKIEAKCASLYASSARALWSGTARVYGRPFLGATGARGYERKFANQRMLSRRRMQNK